MNFNELILNRFHPLFEKYGFEIIEQSDNFLKLKSNRMVLSFARDERENSNLFYAGKTDNRQYLIDGNIIRKFFVPDLKNTFRIPELTVEDFANNLSIFFEGEGKSLISGDTNTMKALEDYALAKSKEYTLHLVEKQNLEAANKSWEEGNYEDFIKIFEKLDKEKLPSSYGMKYKIARQKLGDNK